MLVLMWRNIRIASHLLVLGWASGPLHAHIADSLCMGCITALDRESMNGTPWIELII
jgi:hypothetical protein